MRVIGKGGPFMRLASSRSGLTLLELLVVIAITGILIALLLAAIMRVRETANIAHSKNNLRQIMLATHHFASNKQGAFPKLGYGRTRIINDSVYYPGRTHQIPIQFTRGA
jgi:prepilin-type N-terminal cleavage/methylation domain-containing protein